jgi:serine/threonine-protein kinase HipA
MTLKCYPQLNGAKRFDRSPDNERLHVVSAMTLLQRKDGDAAQLGAGYLEIAELIQSQGARPAQDLEQLWKPSTSIRTRTATA